MNDKGYETETVETTETTETTETIKIKINNHIYEIRLKHNDFYIIEFISITDLVKLSQVIRKREKNRNPTNIILDHLNRAKILDQLKTMNFSYINNSVNEYSLKNSLTKKFTTNIREKSENLNEYSLHEKNPNEYSLKKPKLKNFNEYSLKKPKLKHDMQVKTEYRSFINNINYNERFNDNFIKATRRSKEIYELEPYLPSTKVKHPRCKTIREYLDTHYMEIIQQDKCVYAHIETLPLFREIIEWVLYRLIDDTLQEYNYLRI